MMRLLLLSILLLPVSAWAANDVPVPSSCTPDVNSRLGQLIASKPATSVDNVMVCGMTTQESKFQRGHSTGSHHIHSVRAQFPDGSSKLVEIVTNDDLDGTVSSPAHAEVFAYGQAFFDDTHQFAAGIHDTHCSTHRGADNGWIVVNGHKHPATCSNQ